MNSAADALPEAMKAVVHRIAHVFPDTEIEHEGRWKRLRLTMRTDCEECHGSALPTSTPAA